MGTKRIGLARLEALMENLKRELALGASAGITMGANGYLVPCMPDAALEAVSNAGAASVACYHTQWTSTGTDALTLAAGTVQGQLKKITLVANSGGNCTLTIADPISAALDVVLFQDVGEHIELIWNGTAWRVLSLWGSNDAGPTIS